MVLSGLMCLSHIAQNECYFNYETELFVCKELMSLLLNEPKWLTATNLTYVFKEMCLVAHSIMIPYDKFQVVIVIW